MSTYGRNFEFRVPPVHGQRGGRYASPDSSTLLVMGAPVVHDGNDPDDLGRLVMELATGAQAPPKSGLGGIAIYEHGLGYDVAGNDPALTTYSDYDTIPKNRGIQVIAGERIKVVLKNTEDRTFLQTRDYEGRTMVAGLGATLTLAVGDYLTPGTGNDTAGYWTETADVANAWLVVEKVENDRLAVECRVLFS